MTHHLIEFRFFGKSKSEIKQLTWEINKQFRIRPRHKPVPHVTLAGPFSTRDQQKLIRDFVAICKKTEKMNFRVTGYGTFDDTGVVFIDIEPSPALEEFRWELSQTLQPYCHLSRYDSDKKFSFHGTLAMKLPPHKLHQIKEFIKTKPKMQFNHIMLRATLLRNSKILCEYDFILKKLLFRREAKSRTVLSETFAELKKQLITTHIRKPEQSEEYLEILPEKIDSLESIPVIDLDKRSWYKKLFSLLKKPKIFFISDTHFDHTNIIKYCRRPFSSTFEMNQTMLENWNKTVKPGDVVFFLGDLVFGRRSRHPDHWLKQLNGKIYFVQGNHEIKSRIIQYYHILIIKYNDEKILLVHDPQDIPKKWTGWAICGHHHNNREEFPLINKKTKRINVGVELINYTPVDIKNLLKSR